MMKLEIKISNLAVLVISDTLLGTVGPLEGSSCGCSEICATSRGPPSTERWRLDGWAKVDREEGTKVGIGGAKKRPQEDTDQTCRQ